MAPTQITEIDRALEYFDRTKSRIFNVTNGLTEAQWHFKPAAHRWSIAENIEHMAIVEERVLGPVREQLAQAPPAPAGYDVTEVDRIVFEVIPDRTVRAKAPEFLIPSGKCTSAEALERVSRNYQHLAECVASTRDLRLHGLESPPLKFITNGAYTLMDGLQWMLTAASHDERHVRQIEEVQSDAHYPRN